MADPDRIVQTLTNLLGNAIKYSPPGGAVQVGAERIRGEFVFAVRDEGRGIPEDKLWKVFEPFEQVDSSDARDKGGTGLGLAISRGIVDRHGGRIWAESRLGEGTTVRFTLPTAPEVRPVGPGNDSPVVLVCHDDRDIADGYCAMLHERGYRTLTASVADSIGRAKLARPAAVVVDLEVEGTVTMLETLDSDPRTRAIPVVVVEHPVTDGPLGDAVAAAVQARREAASVLLVEDDGDLAGVLSTLLAGHGLDVVQVTGVADAVARGRQLDPRVVVLDLELPDGDGTEVIAALRREGRLESSAVVVYTSADSFIDRPHPDDLGEVVFLTKTRVTPEQLEDTVLRLLEGRPIAGSPSADVAPEGQEHHQEREEVSGGAGALS
jgi:CheY-like chemotaxis protein